MKKLHKKRTEKLGISFADGLYKNFTEHPEAIGVNFSWEKFPDMCGRLAKVSTFTSFSNSVWDKMTVKQRDELEELCYEAAVKKAEELLDN